VQLLKALVPEEGGRLDRLRERLSGSVPQPTVMVHGDFHEGNILVGEQGISGLLDVDDAGPGERVADLGVLIGRIWSLAHGRAGEPALRYAQDLLRRSEAVVDRDELRRRVGVALVGRATAPFRNQLDGWPELTRRRLELAERVHPAIALVDRHNRAAMPEVRTAGLTPAASPGRAVHTTSFVVEPGWYRLRAAMGQVVSR
jgi:hypothetical protein